MTILTGTKKVAHIYERPGHWVCVIENLSNGKTLWQIVRDEQSGIEFAKSRINRK